MSDARADTLLKSALEKIVYFEARAEQLQSELAGARAEVVVVNHAAYAFGRGPAMAAIAAAHGEFPRLRCNAL